MNQNHKAELDAAVRELNALRSHLPTNEPTSCQTYDVIQRFLDEATQITDEDAFYDHLSSINRFVCDVAPLSKEFIPSFKRLFLELHKRRQGKQPIQNRK
jgi:hypothetical protein